MESPAELTAQHGTLSEAGLGQPLTHGSPEPGSEKATVREKPGECEGLWACVWCECERGHGTVCEGVGEG